MLTKGLLVRLEAKPDKEDQLDALLRSALPMVQDEPATTAWFAFRIGPTTFGIFDVFPDDDGRKAHLSGAVAQALTGRADELLAQPPDIGPIDILEFKLPG